MNRYTLTRDLKPDYGTFGRLIVGDAIYETVERPWCDNAPNVSCVVPGAFVCKLRKSNTNHNAGLDVTYELQDVPGRTAIELHVANYPHDVLGCIGLGRGRAFVGGQWMVTQSRDAIRDFYTRLAGADFLLEIV